MSYEPHVRRRSRRRRTAWAARSGRWARRCSWPATTGSACWRARCSSAACAFATGARPARHRPDHARSGELPDRAARGRARRGAAATRWPQRLCRQLPRPQATAGLALVRADAHLRQRPASAGALRRCAADQATPASLRVARESLEFLEEICFADDRLVLVGNAGWHSPRRDESRTPTSSRSTPPRSCSPSAAPTWRPAIITISAGCASRSPGSWAPTGSGVRSTTPPPPGAATGSAPRAEPERGRREHHLLPVVAAGDAGARRRRSRVRRRRSGRRRSGRHR